MFFLQKHCQYSTQWLSCCVLYASIDTAQDLFWCTEKFHAISTQDSCVALLSRGLTAVHAQSKFTGEISGSIATWWCLPLWLWCWRPFPTTAGSVPRSLRATPQSMVAWCGSSKTGDFLPGDGTASQLNHNPHVDVGVMPTSRPYDDVDSTGDRGGFSDGVGCGQQEDECSDEVQWEHDWAWMRRCVFFISANTGVDHSHNWMHDGRPRDPEDGVPLNPYGITRVPGSQTMLPRSESDTYHHNDAASHGLWGDLLVGPPWQPFQRIGPKLTHSDMSQHAGQPLCDRRLQNDFWLSTVRLNAFGPSGQALLTCRCWGWGWWHSTGQTTGFHLGGRGLYPRQHPPNPGSLLFHDVGEAVFSQGGLYGSHVPRPQSVTSRPDPTSWLPRFLVPQCHIINLHHTTIHRSYGGAQGER